MGLVFKNLLNIYLENTVVTVACSGVLSEPVTWSLVSSESLFSEFLVSTVFDSVHFESVGVTVDIMVLGEQVRHWVDSGNDSKGHAKHDLGIWNLSSGNEHEVLRNVMSHLWC